MGYIAIPVIWVFMILGSANNQHNDRLHIPQQCQTFEGRYGHYTRPTCDKWFAEHPEAN